MNFSDDICWKFNFKAPLSFQILETSDEKNLILKFCPYLENFPLKIVLIIFLKAFTWLFLYIKQT